MTEQIIREICAALIRLTGGKWDAAAALSRVLSEEAMKNDADHVLLSLIGSWGDTLTDEELLQHLRDYNEKGYV